MDQIQLTKTERLILANQYRIRAKLEENESHLLTAKILTQGYSAEYDRNGFGWEWPQDYSDQDQQDVIDLFELLRIFNNTYAKLPPDQQDGIDRTQVHFEGWDGHESRYHFAKFCIEELNLWAEHADAELDSHSKSTEMKHDRMLAAFRSAADRYRLNFEDLQRIATAA